MTSRVIVALILRETKTRFGRTQLGFLWALLEPVAYVSIFVAIRDAIRDSTPFGESTILFIITGLLTIRVFMSIASGTTPAISANKNLLTFPPVKPTDVIAARIVLETLTIYVVVFLFFVILEMTIEYKVIVNFSELVASIAATTLLGAGIGSLNAVVTILLPAWERVWTMIRLPLFILSGIFFVPNALPPAILHVLWWNPLLHCVEWMRIGTYLSYEPVLVKSYALAWGGGSLALALLLERMYRFKLLAS